MSERSACSFRYHPPVRDCTISLTLFVAVCNKVGSFIISVTIKKRTCVSQNVQPQWWSKYDDPILQFLADTGAAVPPRVILFNLERREIASPHRSTIKRRLARLQEYGLVEKVGEEGYYEITDLGKGYVVGEVDAAELEK